MDVGTGALLVGAAAIGGALNAVAGGGAFFTFPALVFAGVETRPANATSALALWPGSLASAAAYRRELSGNRRLTLWFAGASLLGGIAGAVLLVRTPERAFRALLPFLLLIATAMFAAGPRLTAFLRTVGGGHPLPLAAAVPMQAIIATYGGYFGGGMGIMMLAAFSLFGMDNIHQMNGLKSILAVAINGVALATFVASGIIEWVPGLVMTAGAVGGGYAGAAVAQQLDPRWVRAFIVAAGTLLTIWFFVR
jgi:uncharacterized membrane protein YfcA